MNKEGQISSVEEWLSLPEPQLPTVNGAEDKGSIYEISKVGALFISTAECMAKRVKVEEVILGKCLLPTAVVFFDGSSQFCRLPVNLGGWVAECLAMAKNGKKLFPSKVELGVLNGRAYAEFL